MKGHDFNSPVPQSYHPTHVIKMSWTVSFEWAIKCYGRPKRICGVRETWPSIFGDNKLGLGVFVPSELTICENLDLELESREQDKRHNFVHETHISTKSLN